MKLLINTTTLIGTGVTQVAISFIEECKKIDDHTYIIFLSETVKKELNIEDFPENFIFYTFNGYPQQLLKSINLRHQLKKLEEIIDPDAVFSVFGPSYWTPKKPHLQGYASPHYVYGESPFFNKINIIQQLKFFLYKTVHRYFFNKDGKYFVSETEDVSKRATKFLGIEPDYMFTINNTYSEFYNDFKPFETKLLPEKIENEFRLLCLCSFTPHKNLVILNEVIPILKKISKTKFTFVLTVDHKPFQNRIANEVRNSIINIGRIDVSNCPQLYLETDALFLPTLLECFSANYPEAMKMERPILTSNLSFAKTICNDAALYFEPLNPYDIAKKIISLANDEHLREKLVHNGNRRLTAFSSPSERAKGYIDICKKMIKNS